MANEGKYKVVKLDELELNEGQLEGLPENPRTINKEKFEKLKQNISDGERQVHHRRWQYAVQGYVGAWNRDMPRNRASKGDTSGAIEGLHYLG